MAEPQLSIRSGKAQRIARRLARREGRSLAEVVELALEAYELREAGREAASIFYARLVMECGSDIDLDAVIQESRQIHFGPQL